MPVTHEATTAAETAACRASASPCPACAKRAGAVVGSGVIHNYGSAPRNGYQPRRTDGESPTAPTFGVELELQRGPSRDRTDLTGEEMVAAAAPRGWWHAQHDGSVDGPEFASQPGSLAYWRSIRPNVASFMRTAIHANWRSHDGRLSCSMHVNVGQSAFADAGHLARFIRLVTVNPRFTTRLAQRTHEQVAAWASFRPYPDNAACERYANAYWRDGAAYTGHGVAVNLENVGRIEFRVPRGTLRVDRFYAKLEWVAASVEFTRDPANRPTPGAFTQWVLARREDYPEFVGMLTDLMPARVNPAAARPAAARPATAGSPDDACAHVSPLTRRTCGIRRSDHNTPEDGATHAFRADPLIAPAIGRCRELSRAYPYGQCERLTGHSGRHSVTDPYVPAESVEWVA